MGVYIYNFQNFPKTRVQFQVPFFQVSDTLLANLYAKMKLKNELNSLQNLVSKIYPIGKTYKKFTLGIKKNFTNIILKCSVIFLLFLLISFKKILSIHDMWAFQELKDTRFFRGNQWIFFFICSFTLFSSSSQWQLNFLTELLCKLV